MKILKKINKKIRKTIRRSINKRHRYDYSETSIGFVKSGHSCIESDKTYFDPYVTVINNKLFLIVSDRIKGCVSSFLFEDGKLSNERVILTGVKNTWYDVINRSCVVKNNSLYYLFFTGQNNDESRIGVAISDDGFNYKINEKPVLVPTMSFEKKSVMNPCVIYDRNKNIFRMWYSAGEFYEPDVICYAESSDCINWNKIEKPCLQKSSLDYDSYKVGGCDVFVKNDIFYMFYIGYQNLDNARVCLAKSHDGLNWERSKFNPIISPSKKSWDADACYKPAFYYDSEKNESYIFYNGRKKDKETIGYVQKKGFLE